MREEAEGVREEAEGVREEAKGVREEAKGVREEAKGVREEAKGVRQETEWLRAKAEGVKETGSVIPRSRSVTPVIPQSRSDCRNLLSRYWSWPLPHGQQIPTLASLRSLVRDDRGKHSMTRVAARAATIAE